MNQVGPYIAVVTPGRKPIAAANGLLDPSIPYAPGVRNLVELVHAIYLTYGNAKANNRRKQNVETFVREITPTIEGSIKKFEGAGYLLEVEVRKFARTGVAAAHYDLLKAIGPGMSPTDALRGSLSENSFGQSPAEGTAYDWDRSFFIWLTPENGALKVEIVDQPRQMYKSARNAIRTRAANHREKVRILQGIVAKYSQLANEIALTLEKRNEHHERDVEQARRVRGLGRLHQMTAQALIVTHGHLKNAEKAEHRAFLTGTVARFFGWGAETGNGLRETFASSNSRKRVEGLHSDVEQLARQVESLEERINEAGQNVQFNSIRIFRDRWD